MRPGWPQEVRSALGWGQGPIADHLLALAAQHALVFRLPLGDLHSGFFFNHRSIGFCAVVNSQLRTWGVISSHWPLNWAMPSAIPTFKDVWVLRAEGTASTPGPTASPPNCWCPTSPWQERWKPWGGGVAPLPSGGGSSSAADVRGELCPGGGPAPPVGPDLRAGLPADGSDLAHRTGAGVGVLPTSPLTGAEAPTLPPLATAPRPHAATGVRRSGQWRTHRSPRPPGYWGVSTEQVAGLGNLPPVEESESAVWDQMDGLGGW